MERGRRVVFWGIGVCVVLLLAFVLIIVLLPDKEEKKKKPDDVPTEESSEEIPKQSLVSEISTWDKSKNETEETVLIEYDEIGRWSKVIRTCRGWYTGAEWEQRVYEFSYPYVNGEPYTVVTLSGLYEGWTQTNTYDSSGHLRKLERVEENPDEPGQKVVTRTALFDENGRETLMNAYWLSGSNRAREEIEYDVYGHCVKWVLTEWDKSGNKHVNDRSKSEFDAKGRAVRYLSSEGLVCGVQYLDDGSRIEVEYEDESSGKKWREYYYDSEGRVVKEMLYSADGVVWSTTEYEYTPTGYKTFGKYTEDGVLGETEAEYDSETGMLIYSKDYLRNEEYSVVRDDDGRITSKEWKDFEGHLQSKKTYEYDEKGNLISTEDETWLMTFKYVPASLTEEQEKERAKFYLDEELYQWVYYSYITY